jgi:hypothetical protein
LPASWSRAEYQWIKNLLLFFLIWLPKFLVIYSPISKDSTYHETFTVADSDTVNIGCESAASLPFSSVGVLLLRVSHFCDSDIGFCWLCFTNLKFFMWRVLDSFLALTSPCQMRWSNGVCQCGVPSRTPSLSPVTVWALTMAGFTRSLIVNKYSIYIIFLKRIRGHVYCHHTTWSISGEGESSASLRRVCKGAAIVYLPSDDILKVLDSDSFCRRSSNLCTTVFVTRNRILI